MYIITYYTVSDVVHDCMYIILHHITSKQGYNFGLYRDDGLGVMNASARVIENVKLKKDLCSIFSQFELKITIKTNMKIIDFLDVTLNLSSGKYQPYSKPNNIPLYVHSKSNHLPSIIRNNNLNRGLNVAKET